MSTHGGGDANNTSNPNPNTNPSINTLTLRVLLKIKAEKIERILELPITARVVTARHRLNELYPEFKNDKLQLYWPEGGIYLNEGRLLQKYVGGYRGPEGHDNIFTVDLRKYKKPLELLMVQHEDGNKELVEMWTSTTAYGILRSINDKKVKLMYDWTLCLGDQELQLDSKIPAKAKTLLCKRLKAPRFAPSMPKLDTTPSLTTLPVVEVDYSDIPARMRSKSRSSSEIPSSVITPGSASQFPKSFSSGRAGSSTRPSSDRNEDNGLSARSVSPTDKRGVTRSSDKGSAQKRNSGNDTRNTSSPRTLARSSRRSAPRDSPTVGREQSPRAAHDQSGSSFGSPTPVNTQTKPLVPPVKAQVHRRRSQSFNMTPVSVSPRSNGLLLKTSSPSFNVGNNVDLMTADLQITNSNTVSSSAPPMSSILSQGNSPDQGSAETRGRTKSAPKNSRVTEKLNHRTRDEIGPNSSPGTPESPPSTGNSEGKKKKASRKPTLTKTRGDSDPVTPAKSSKLFSISPGAQTPPPELANGRAEKTGIKWNGTVGSPDKRISADEQDDSTSSNDDTADTPKSKKKPKTTPTIPHWPGSPGLAQFSRRSGRSASTTGSPTQLSHSAGPSPAQLAKLKREKSLGTPFKLTKRFSSFLSLNKNDKLLATGGNSGPVIVRSDGLIVVVEEDGRKSIRGGTLEKILEQLLKWLLTEGNRKEVFHWVHIFISTYRLVSTPVKLGDMLITLWNQEAPPDVEDGEGYQSRVRSSIMFFLSGWFEVQFQDFSEDLKFKNSISAFIDSMPDAFKAPLSSKLSLALRKPEPSEFLFGRSKSSIRSESLSTHDLTIGLSSITPRKFSPRPKIEPSSGKRSSRHTSDSDEGITNPKMLQKKKKSDGESNANSDEITPTKPNSENIDSINHKHTISSHSHEGLKSPNKKSEDKHSNRSGNTNVDQGKVSHRQRTENSENNSRNPTPKSDRNNKRGRGTALDDDYDDDRQLFEDAGSSRSRELDDSLSAPPTTPSSASVHSNSTGEDHLERIPRSTDSSSSPKIEIYHCVSDSSPTKERPNDNSPKFRDKSPKKSTHKRSRGLEVTVRRQSRDDARDEITPRTSDEGIYPRKSPFGAVRALPSLTKLRLTDLPIRELAEHWTLLDLQNFMEISRIEFVSNHCPNWNRMQSRSNMLTKWVASEIVCTLDFDKRVEYLKKAIELGEYFSELNNFNALMCVWGALKSVSVSRLSQTRQALPPEIQTVYDTLKVRLTEAGNFTPLQMEVDRALAKSESLVPWFELLAKNRNMALELSTYLSAEDIGPEEEPRANEPPLLNFAKLHVLGEQILKFDKYQQVNSGFVVRLEEYNVNEAVTEFLQNLPILDDDVMWDLSIECEPSLSQMTPLQ